MKPCRSNQNSRAMTLIEVLVIIFVLAVLVAMVLPALSRAKRRGGPNCYGNLREIGLAYQIWAGDNGGKYPMEVSVSNGGTMELFSNGSQFQNFPFLNYLAMSNELSTPKILHCPGDTNHMAATDFGTSFNNSSISYFLGLDASRKFPQAVLCGDDNFEISGVTVKSGLLQLSANTPIAWSAARHKFVGNIVLADGSVQQLNNSDLTNLLHQTGLATNRLTIP
jgi:type II secretory pathway pseudopilin PulG